MDNTTSGIDFAALPAGCEMTPKSDPPSPMPKKGIRNASKAIDGNRSGSYSDGGQSHTREDTEDPWWEVDLGAEFPIDSIHIYNRTDGFLRHRLDPFTLKVLDNSRKVVFEKQFEHSTAVRCVVRDNSTGRVAMTVGDAIQVYDPAEQKFVGVPGDLPKRTGESMAAPGDGELYFGSGKDVIALNLSTMKFQTIGTAPDKIERLAVDNAGFR